MTGTDAAALQTTYAARPLTDEMFVSSIFPFGAIIAACVSAEEKLAGAIARSADRTARSYLRAFTGALTSGTDIPSVTTSGEPIIGNLGAVRDAFDTTKVLTRKPVPYIQNRLLAPSIYLIPVYQYALDGGIILHTREDVVIECCTYNAATQTQAYINNDDSVLPDDLAEATVQGALALLVRDDEFLAQSTQYGNFFATQLAAIPPATFEQQAV